MLGTVAFAENLVICSTRCVQTYTFMLESHNLCRRQQTKFQQTSAARRCSFIGWIKKPWHYTECFQPSSYDPFCYSSPTHTHLSIFATCNNSYSCTGYVQVIKSKIINLPNIQNQFPQAVCWIVYTAGQRTGITRFSLIFVVGGSVPQPCVCSHLTRVFICTFLFTTRGAQVALPKPAGFFLGG